MLELTGKPASLKTIVPDRPGHDRRYLLDATKIRDRARLDAVARVRRRARRDGRLVRGEPRLVGAAQGARPGRGVCLAVERAAFDVRAVADLPRRFAVAQPELPGIGVSLKAARFGENTLHSAELPWSLRARVSRSSSSSAVVARHRRRPRPAAPAVVLRRGGVRRLRTRMGPRRRHEPVRRVRAGARRAHVRPDPGALLHGHEHREGRPQGAARPPRRGPSCRDRLFDRPVHRGRRDGNDVQASEGPLTLRADLALPSDVGPGRGDTAARRPSRQEGAARARREAVSRQARARPAGRASCAS